MVIFKIFLTLDKIDMFLQETFEFGNRSVINVATSSGPSFNNHCGPQTPAGRSVTAVCPL